MILSSFAGRHRDSIAPVAATAPARTIGRASLLTLLALSVSGCTSLLGGGGPTTDEVKHAAGAPLADAQIKIINVTDQVARQVIASSHPALFSDVLGEGQPVGTVIGRGDILDIALWEAPPAVLFGAAGGEARLASATSASSASAGISAATARGTSIPEQLVDDNGRIVVPFIGAMQVAGRDPRQVEKEIASRLAGKAHEPQAIVRIVRNTTANVTVVGDVTTNTRVPLTPHGERLLDVLATAGGVKQPVNKTTIQISRAGRTVALPLEQIIRDPKQNVRLSAEDVVTAYFQPYSFISLGATGAASEVNFEGTGITLAQALGRVGGLRDERANPKGVFIFRLEDPAALDPATAADTRTTPDGKVPVIYRVDLSDPASFFIAQSFPIRNSDVIYVTNAPVADLQKFVNIVSSMAFSIIGVTNITQ
jgi:polysaccharide export outer membrane protein